MRKSSTRDAVRRVLLTIIVLLPGCSVVEVGPPVETELGGTDARTAELIRELVAEVKSKPGDPAARAALGMAYEVSGMIRSARSCYEQAVALEPDEPRLRYFLAHARARLGDLHGALADLERVLRAAETYAPAHLYLGQWMLELGRVDDASAAFDRLLELEPNHPGGWLGRARVQVRRGESEAAAEILERLLLGRRHPYLYQLLGQAYREAGELDRARSALSRAKPDAPPPSWPDPWREEKDRYRRGLGALARRAESLLEQGRSGEVIELLEPWLREEPTNAALLTGLSLAYRGVGRPERELELLRAALAAHPDDPVLQLRIAAAYHERGELEPALRHIERAIEIRPRNAHAHAQRARYLGQEGRHREALDAIDRALKLGAREPGLLLDAGVLEARLQNWTGAVERFESAIELDPMLAPAYVGLGGSRAELGDLVGAEAALERVARIEPQHPGLHAARRRVAELRAATE